MFTKCVQCVQIGVARDRYRRVALNRIEMQNPHTGSCCSVRSGGLAAAPSTVGSTGCPQSEQVLQPLASPAAAWSELPPSLWHKIFAILMAEDRHMVRTQHAEPRPITSEATPQCLLYAHSSSRRRPCAGHGMELHSRSSWETRPPHDPESERELPSVCLTCGSNMHMGLGSSPFLAAH